MRVGSLFAGIGGFDLAARWMGWETVWYSEIDPYASAVMKKHFPEAINLGDITKIDGKQAPSVDILCGGFPCQDISLAGKGAGITGERSGLWSHYARLIEEIRPRYVLIENVSALRSRGLEQVLGGLASIGYDAEWHCVPAAYVGAPHRRDRIWICAYPNADGRGLEISSQLYRAASLGGEHNSGTTLTDFVTLWPTPQASPNQNRDTKVKPSCLTGGHGWSLAGAVIDSLAGTPHRNWPTPRANDPEKRGGFDMMNPRNGLPAAVKRAEAGIFGPLPPRVSTTSPNHSTLGSRGENE